MPTREQYEIGIGNAQRAGDTEAAQYLIQRAAAEVTGKAGIAANLGAGFSNVIEGGKQLLGMGMSDEQLHEKRRIDEMAAESTPGGGFAQFMGEAAPSLLIPGGTGARLINRGLTAARGGSRFMTVPTAAQAAGRLSVPMSMGGAALESGAAAAFMPTTSDESRLGNIATGTAFGAATPLLAKALAAGGRGVRQFADQGIAALPGGIGARAAERVAGREATQGLTRAGVEIDPARYAAQDYQPNTTAAGPRTQALGEFEPTTAAAYSGRPGQPGTAAPGLAQVEKAVRGFDPSAWEARDAREAAKRWTHLDESLRGQPDIDAARAHARTLDPPYSAISPRHWDSNMAGFTRDLENMVDTPAYIGNPTVKSAIDMMRKQIDSNTIVPETLHELRKTLASGMKGTPGLSDTAVAAARSDPHLLRLIDRIDNVMEDSTYASHRGDWADWRSRYSATMREAEGSKAEERLRRAFVSDTGVPLRGTAEVPQLGAGLERQAATARTVVRGPQAGQNLFTAQANQAVADIVRDLHANGIVDRVRKAATLGGSDTAYNLTTSAVAGTLIDLLMGGGGLIGAGAKYAVRAAGQTNIERAKRELMTGIMQDPAQFRQFIAAAAQRAQQMAAQRGLSAGTRYGAAGASAAQVALKPDEEARLRAALAR